MFFGIYFLFFHIKKFSFLHINISYHISYICKTRSSNTNILTAFDIAANMIVATAPLILQLPSTSLQNFIICLDVRICHLICFSLFQVSSETVLFRLLIWCIFHFGGKSCNIVPTRDVRIYKF